MKFIASVFLIVALSDSFHCAPLIGNGGYSSWGYNVGVDGNIGVEGGWNNGRGSLGVYGHGGANFGGFRRNGQLNMNQPIVLLAPPHYAQLIAVPFNTQYGTHLPQYAPQHIPQGAPQNIPHPAVPYNPQFTPRTVPQGAPGTVTMSPPQYDI